MNRDTTLELASLRFEGERFGRHALDVECTQELVAYRNIVLECAKALWRRRNPGRVRLPKGFEDGFRLQFSEVLEGSAVVPLRRVQFSEQGELDLGDDFDAAATLIDETITAADGDDLLPDALPPSVIPLFCELGRSLRPDETLFTRSRHNNVSAAYTARARERLAEWSGPTYEDVVDIVGEVRMVNVGSGQFSMQPAGSDAQVMGRFDPGHEGPVLEALRHHRTARLRVQGTGEFSTTDGQMRRFVRVESVTVATTSEREYDDTATPIWQRLEALGQSVPPAVWESVPDDLSTRIDEVVYGTERRSS
jgi:hypothetical protein